LGANAIIQPAIEISEPKDWEPVDQAIGRLGEFDILVFSSANGVHYFFKRLLKQGHDVRALGNAKLAVIGPRTAAALREYSLNADLEPTSYRAEALAEALQQYGVQGKQLLLLRASRGREVLSDQLTAAGATVEQVVVYSSQDVTTCDDEVEELWQQVIANDNSVAVDSEPTIIKQPPAIDWITVTSSAIARSICAMWGDRLNKVKLASISPITSQALRDLGHEPTVEAKVYTTDGVIDAILAKESAVDE
jgi:uroporphyrinogen III methyltransferase/synthase